MWDIKQYSPAQSSHPLMYYLNHVGYKDSLVLKKIAMSCWYYLNHVGYKALCKTCASRGRLLYYLNHVGYKVKPIAWWRNYFERII